MAAYHVSENGQRMKMGPQEGRIPEYAFPNIVLKAVVCANTSTVT